MKCEDIDECDTGDANCDVANQACLNTIGSFKCLDILNKANQVNQCEDGFRYQARIDQCVGEQKTSYFTPEAWFYCNFFIFLRLLFQSTFKDVNECSEGIDDCNRQTQLCLNMAGGFKCQDKVTENCITGLQYNTNTRLCEGALLHALFPLHWYSIYRSIEWD